MKGDSEGKVRAALKAIDLTQIIYKPPDDARNWKPCDFMLFREGRAQWLEVKDLPTQVGTFPMAELRPSQRQGILEAWDNRIPYWLVCWWRRRQVWSISDAHSVLMLAQTEGHTATGISYPMLTGRLGVESQPRLLSSTLKQALLGELGRFDVDPRP